MKLDRRILNLAIPNILSNLTVPLLGLVDIALAGHLNDVAAIGALAVGTTIFNLIYWCFAFLRMGTTGMTAQAHGAHDTVRMGRLLMQSAFIALFSGVLIYLFQTPLYHLVQLILIPTGSAFTDYASTYYHIVIYGAPAVLVAYVLNGWFIGMQNAIVPMAVSIITNIINISVSALLVMRYQWGIEGIAIGTVVAHWVGMFILVITAYLSYVRTHKVILSRRLADLLVGIRQFFSTNFFILTRSLLMITITTFFTYAGTRMGDLTLATNALLLQFFTIFSYFTDGFAYAAEALSGHFYGRRDRHSLNYVIRRLLLWGGGFALLTTLVYWIFSSQFLNFLTDKAEVVTHAQNYLIWIYLIPLSSFIAFVWDGVFIGLTAAKEMTLTMLIAVGLFFVIYNTIQLPDPNHTLWLSYLLFLLARSVVQSIIYKRVVTPRYLYKIT